MQAVRLTQRGLRAVLIALFTSPFFGHCPLECSSDGGVQKVTFWIFGFDKPDSGKGKAS